MLTPINVAADDCVFTITARYGAMSITNLIGGGHYPMTAVLEITANAPTPTQKDSIIQQTTNDMEQQFRIRKLTPRECYRLMDVSDKDIDKLLATDISKTQHYKLAGNSIVVSCLYHILKNLYDDERPTKPTQLKLF